MSYQFSREKKEKIESEATKQQSYTKGKWALRPGRNLLYAEKIKGLDYEATMQRCFYVVGPEHESQFVADIITDARQEENARRIVACVNACAGIDTRVLEDFAAAKEAGII
jgi:hypothetical protein